MNRSRSLLIAVAGAALALFAVRAHSPALAQGSSASPSAAGEGGDETFGVATVRVDGHALFRVHGVATIPAPRRAENIAARIAAAAADPTVQPESLTVVDSANGSQILAGDRPLILISDSDGHLERLSRSQLTFAYLPMIRGAIHAYREERKPASLIRSGLFAAAATLLAFLLFAALMWSKRRLELRLEAAFQRRLAKLKHTDVELAQTKRAWTAAEKVFELVTWLIALVIVVVYVQYVLGLFPWTRAAAGGLLGYVTTPLRVLGTGLLSAVPNLVFLLVVAVITRLVLRFLALIAEALQRQALTLKGFDPDWAWPTYRIARTIVLLFAVVFAYPFIPGSSTDAFKGVSIFIGVLVSLGSTSVIGNLLSGYTMIYRRAFRVGDRVKIDNEFGEVQEIRVTVTHLRSTKNEEIILPNSLIMNSKVINYSALARSRGLVLHTNVGVGYEVPWRQVEAMLLTAAGLTRGVLKDPPPFVLQRGLGDFAVDYELNAVTNDATRILAMYNELHQHILDQFNEFGVQIMTPAYEGDPDSAKIVPRSKWYAAPAAPPAGTQAT